MCRSDIIGSIQSKKRLSMMIYGAFNQSSCVEIKVRYSQHCSFRSYTKNWYLIGVLNRRAET